MFSDQSLSSLGLQQKTQAIGRIVMMLPSFPADFLWHLGAELEQLRQSPDAPDSPLLRLLPPESPKTDPPSPPRGS